MIINSLLDTDAYTFTQAQVVFHNYSNIMVKYKFKCRNGSPIPSRLHGTEFIEHIRTNIDHFCSLKFRDDELNYLWSLGLFKPTFLEFLRTLRLNSRYVKLSLINGELYLSIKGPWYLTIFFEVPLLAIISEVYHRYTNPGAEVDAMNILTDKIKRAKAQLYGSKSENDFRFTDFGTRRRYSRNLQSDILEACQRCLPHNFMGTSNVMFSKEIGLKPKGTMSHQYLQAHQQITRLKDHQKVALDVWAREYEGDLGIALSDVVGFKAFLNDFNKYYAKLFDGCRHDSGDPYEWCRLLIDHYNSLKIDPMTKQAIFSDGLSFSTAIDLFLCFRENINTSFGIGTNLTNDTGVDALQIVIKMIECNGEPVAKISDSEGKGMCEDELYLNHLKKVFNI